MASLLVALVLALAVVVVPSPAGGRVCVSGTALGCDDRNPCTDDRCVNLTCVHTPATGPACNDHDGCTENDRCAAGTCVGVPVTCADDGLSCTDDVCLGGGCTHVPVDSRCVPEDACTTSVCAPERPTHEPTGCAPGPPQTDAQECAEDGDACTADVCGLGRCVHEPVADQETCSAVEGAFRQALALENAARGLETAMSPATPIPVLTRLAGIRDALATTSRILSGKAGADARATQPGDLPETPVQQRARLALAVLVRERPQIAAFVRNVGGSFARGRPETAFDIGRRGRILLRGTRALRADLRRLLSRRGTFVH